MQKDNQISHNQLFHTFPISDHCNCWPWQGKLVSQQPPARFCSFLFRMLSVGLVWFIRHVSCVWLLHMACVEAVKIDSLKCCFHDNCFPYVASVPVLTSFVSLSLSLFMITMWFGFDWLIVVLVLCFCGSCGVSVAPSAIVCHHRLFIGTFGRSPSGNGSPCALPPSVAFRVLPTRYVFQSFSCSSFCFSIMIILTMTFLFILSFLIYFLLPTTWFLHFYATSLFGSFMLFFWCSFLLDLYVISTYYCYYKNKNNPSKYPSISD